MIVVKKITSLHLMNIKYLRKYKHKNLIALLKIYKFENLLFAVIKYTVMFLTQIIIISLKLKKNHIFYVYNQISLLSTFTKYLLTFTDASRNKISIRVYNDAY